MRFWVDVLKVSNLISAGGRKVESISEWATVQPLRLPSCPLLPCPPNRSERIENLPRSGIPKTVEIYFQVCCRRPSNQSRTSVTQPVTDAVEIDGAEPGISSGWLFHRLVFFHITVANQFRAGFICRSRRNCLDVFHKYFQRL